MLSHCECEADERHHESEEEVVVQAEMSAQGYGEEPQSQVCYLPFELSHVKINVPQVRDVKSQVFVGFLLRESEALFRCVFDSVA
jgi:hypothetical protein